MLTIGLVLLVIIAFVNCAALTSIGVHLWVGHVRSAVRARSAAAQPNEDDVAWTGFAARLVTRGRRPVSASRPVPGATP